MSKRRVNARVNAELEEHVYGTPKPNDDAQRAHTWRSTQAPADPWDARIPPRNKRETD